MPEGGDANEESKVSYDLLHETDGEPPSQDTNDDDTDDDEGPPFSLSNELKFFAYKGSALGGAAILEWGVPPLVAMLLAGQVKGSAQLQSALGYGRVFYNCTSLMVILALCNYFNTVLPGCIGAGRKDRIPHYFRRGMVISTLVLVPFLILQLFAGDVMEAVGVQEVIADDVEAYTKLMVINSWLLLLEIHVEAVFINLNYAWWSTANSLISGLAVDCVCSYFFIYRFDWGVQGAAYTQILVKLARLAIWLVLACRYGLLHFFVAPSSSSGKESEPVFADLVVYRDLTVSGLASNLSGWFIYEIQLVAVANVHGISKPALAAGAIWVQLESTIASVQTGWISATSMRTLNLLGKMDPGAGKSFVVLCSVSAFVVALTNIPILIWREDISTLLTNDPDVRWWLSKIVWVLVLHSQTRISCLNAILLFIPIGKAVVGVLLNFVSFYFIATPLVALLSLTDLVLDQDQIAAKLECIVATSSVAQAIIAVVGFAILASLDWDELAALIRERANSDKEALETKAEPPPQSDLEQPLTQSLRP